MNIYAKKRHELTGLLGRRMALLRKRAGFTQESLAQATHREINFNTISVLERGLGDPKISTLNEIARALHITLADLVDFNRDETVDALSEEQQIQKGIAILKRLSPQTLDIAVRQLDVLDKADDLTK